MATNHGCSIEIETNKDQSRKSSVNLGDNMPSHRNEKPSSEQQRDSNHTIHPVPLRINPQAPSIPGLSFGHNSPHTPSNPYRHVSQGSFFSALQDNYRHSSIDSSSAWDNSGSIAPFNDRRRLISITWASRSDFLKDDMASGTATARGPFRDVAEDEKEPESPTTDDISPTSTVRSDSIPGACARAPTPAPGPPLGPPPPTWSKPHEWLFIATVCSAQFLSLASLAQTISPLLIIGNDLNVENPGQLAWFTAAYSMTLGTFIIPAGE
jgi:hypothetical protein